MEQATLQLSSTAAGGTAVTMTVPLGVNGGAQA
jgi:hypothetical protein